MANEIENFKSARDNLAQAKKWAEMIGKTYYGGTSGKGDIGRIDSAGVAATVYYQEYDGATNYHTTPTAMREALAEVLIEQQAILVPKAIERMQLKVDDAAKLAVAAHALLMQEAGLEAA